MKIKMSNQSKKRGRKPVPLAWPQGEFCAEQLVDQSCISRVSVHSKIKRGLESGEIHLVKKEKAKMGRPKCIYSTTAPTTASVSSAT